MLRYKLLFLLLAFIGGAFLLAAVANAKVPTPQIYQVVPSQDNSYRPWVTGWTPNEVEVEVLVDEEPQGFAKVVKDESGTASFGWSPQKNLSLGWHEFRVRGKYGDEYSQAGAILGFTVKPPTPAPTLEEPEQFDDYILLKGLVRNGLSVKIYIDDLLAADFLVPEHPSGTTNFWFKSRGLLNGLHEVYVVAYDNTGKLSKKSEVRSFKTEQQKITKGEEGESGSVVMEDKPEQDKEAGSEAIDKVVEPEAEGEVGVMAEKIEGEVKILPDEENGEVMVKEDESEQASGEVSSIEEVSGTTDNEAETDNFDREKRNRTAGLVILVIMVVILLIWYWWERKKINSDIEPKTKSDDKDENNQTDEPKKEDKGDSLGL